jgi:signal transduction histidine kinase
MGWQVTLLSTPTLLACLISLFLLGYILTVYRDRPRDPVVVLYLWITVAAIVWTGFSALKLLQTDPATKLLFYRLLHVGAAVLAPLILLFVIAVTDRDRWLRPETVGAVFLFPAVFLLLLFFGPGGLIISGTQLIENGLIVLRVADGPGFILFLAYNTLVGSVTLGIVLFEAHRLGRAYYPQAGLLAVAVVVPILFGGLTAAGIPPFVDDRVNLVPTSATVSVAAFGLLLYRYRIVDLPPLAYATAMKYSPDTLLVLDQERRVVHTNDHGRALLDAPVGSPLSESLPAFDPGSMSDELLELTSSSGEVTYHRVFSEPLCRGGRRVGWVVVLRDETDQQQQQERLRRKNEQMELFASTISHDLRNPLSVARGYLQLVRDEVEREELEKVESAHDRMAEIIDEVLTLARAGKRIDTLEAVPIRTIIDGAWDNVSADTAALSVEVDRTVMADPTMLQHVFENLFRNAIEHGGTGVKITVAGLDDGVYVEDDGAGIPPDSRNDVFEVGYSTTTEGTGLGLSLVRQILDAHGWEIRVTEGTDGGARFEITGVESAE